MLEKLRIGRFSGSYKRRNATELAREKKLPTIGVTVLFLDDSLNTFVIEVSYCRNQLTDEVKLILCLVFTETS